LKLLITTKGPYDKKPLIACEVEVIGTDSSNDPATICAILNDKRMFNTTFIPYYEYKKEETKGGHKPSN